jgi:glyceraldehyde-3-phosphate dehydrogenase/erythrose-4-phosphate dehydrogenase
MRIAMLPWKDMGIDLVLECSGRFRMAWYDNE